VSAAVLDRTTPEGRAAQPDAELDLRGLDFAARRRGLFTALRQLRYEMEARLDHRYCWSAAGETSGAATYTVVHLCPSETATRSS
jgi:hypothetical protein